MISKKDIEHLATLARIELTDDEKEKFRHDLERILEYVEKLTLADTDRVGALARITEGSNILRHDADEVRLASEPHELVEAAPGEEKGHIKVRSIWN